MGDKVVVVEYSSCIYESAFEAISIHKTLAGASKAMNLYKSEKYLRDIINMDEDDENNYYFVSKRIHLEDQPFYSFRYKFMSLND